MVSPVNRKIMLVFLVLLLAGSAYGIGIAPAKQSVEFQPSLEDSLKIRVLNPEGKPMKAIVYPKGDLAETVRFKKSIVSFSQGETEKTIDFNLTLPEKIDKPGVHEIDLVAMHLPDDAGSAVVIDGSKVVFESEEKGTVVQATTAVVSKLSVFVPYPDKYAEGKIFVEDAEVGGYAGFKLPVYNFGSEAIGDIQASIEIRGPTNEVLATVITQSESLSVQDEVKLLSRWKADVNPGLYHAIATVTYDDKSFTVKKNFYVGSMRVEVVGVSVPEFKHGDIAKFQIDLMNRWNRPINDVYAHLFVLDKQGREYADFKTSSVSIAPGSVEKVNAYWDTKDISPGDYDIKLQVNYAEKVTEKLFNATVTLNEIVTDFSPTANVIADSEGSDGNTILIILIVVLIGINVAWMFIFTRRKQSQPPQNQPPQMQPPQNQPSQNQQFRQNRPNQQPRQNQPPGAQQFQQAAQNQPFQKPNQPSQKFQGQSSPNQFYQPENMRKNPP